MKCCNQIIGIIRYLVSSCKKYSMIIVMYCSSFFTEGSVSSQDGPVNSAKIFLGWELRYQMGKQ